MIRIPVHMVEKLNKVVHIERQLVQRLGREPEPRGDRRRAEISPTRSARSSVFVMPISLEKPIGEDDDLSGRLFPTSKAESPFDTLPATRGCGACARTPRAAKASRDRAVVRLRRCATVHAREVGQAFGVTRERIRQIENNTLKKLQSLPEAQGLKDCVAAQGQTWGRALILFSSG